jgi:hypothetical protein
VRRLYYDTGERYLSVEGRPDAGAAAVRAAFCYY